MRISIFYYIICLLAIFSCQKLPRDNPRDNNSNNSNAAKIKGPHLKYSRHEVYSDNNNDQQINKGESIKLKVFVNNDGTEKAEKVKVVYKTNSNFVSGLSPVTQVSFLNSTYNDYIEPDEEGAPYSSNSYLSFSVSANTPIGTVIVINLTITDGSNNTWEEQFSITVVATSSSISFSRYEVYEDNNNDLFINKGELIKLKVYLKNNGSARANGIKAIVTCTNSYVTSLMPSNAVSVYNSSYSNYLDSGEEGSPYSSSSYLSFNISSNTPIGTNIKFNISITDESGNNWQDSFTVTVTATNASMKYSRLEIYSDDNSNQILNAGETPKLKVYLKNLGSSRANKLRTTITCTSNYISNLSGNNLIAFYNNTYSDYCQPNEEASPYSASSYLNFKISSGTPPGTVLSFSVSVNDESSNNWNDTFSITVY